MRRNIIIFNHCYEVLPMKACKNMKIPSRMETDGLIEVSEAISSLRFDISGILYFNVVTSYDLGQNSSSLYHHL